jgi:large subunit ribosomal protein L22
MEVKSGARFVKTAPDKIRIMAKMLKGKNIQEAIDQLTFSPKAAAKPLMFVFKQAREQAANGKTVISEETLKVREIRIDEGPKLKRRRLVNKGRSTTILKRMSHITIVLSDNGNSKAEIRNLGNIKKETVKENIKTTEGSI